MSISIIKIHCTPVYVFYMLFSVRDRPFNLKGEGGYGFFRSKIFFLLLNWRSGHFFRDKLWRHYFFSAKTSFFFREKVLSKYYCLPMSETEHIFPSNFLTETISPKLNGYSLNCVHYIN